MNEATGRRDAVDALVEAWRADLPTFAGVELELCKRASRLSILIHEATNASLAALGLTKAEHEVLSVLRAAGAPYRLRPVDLIDRLRFSSGGTSNLLRRLVEDGLLVKEADDRDARSTWVRLTERGVQTTEAAVRAQAEAQHAVLARVSPEAARAAADALREVLLALGDLPTPDGAKKPR